jgi:D-erythro-7,8-dihydroneopterin triphosphate epimerase
MDRILINDLLIRCIIGVHEEERGDKQDVVVNLAVTTDLQKAGRSDRIEDALDYSILKKKIMAMADNSRFFLAEAFAEAVADICLENPAVSQVLVRVEKPTALRFARSVGVEITRKREKGS